MSRAMVFSRRDFFVVVGLMAGCVVPGCMEDNNAEFAKKAPPGPPDPYDGQTQAERRARTRRLSPMEKKAEAKRKANAEKAKAAEK